MTFKGRGGEEGVRHIEGWVGDTGERVRATGAGGGVGKRADFGLFLPQTHLSWYLSRTLLLLGSETSTHSLSRPFSHLSLACFSNHQELQTNRG